ncbi:MAG: SRPBCC family protein [Chthoniobacter sp.]|uniref:SRPBCC family protein n=1 Tax=Chthoniobacter sp. TaxID=2510640 RepID=UPI0032A78FCF
MPVHILRRTQIVPARLEACWDFFSDPRNLTRITPPALDFRVCGEQPPRVYAGMMLTYRVRPLLGVPVTWVTEITHVEAPHRFVDEQRIGPYAIWHHEHFFTALDDGRTEVRDLVHYVLPFGVLGDLVHPWLVAPQLERIFAFREKAVTEHFGGHPLSATP